MTNEEIYAIAEEKVAECHGWILERYAEIKEKMESGIYREMSPKDKKKMERALRGQAVSSCRRRAVAQMIVTVAKRNNEIDWSTRFMRRVITEAIGYAPQQKHLQGAFGDEKRTGSGRTDNFYRGSFSGESIKKAREYFEETAFPILYEMEKIWGRKKFSWVPPHLTAHYEGDAARKRAKGYQFDIEDYDSVIEDD